MSSYEEKAIKHFFDRRSTFCAVFVYICEIEYIYAAFLRYQYAKLKQLDYLKVVHIIHFESLLHAPCPKVHKF